jgi:hypothetical protein
MLADFCLRLACGMIACLLVLSPAQVQPRFYRVHFLTALGLGLVAALMLGQQGQEGPTLPWMLLAAMVVLPFLGSAIWSLDRAWGKGTVIALTTIAFTASICLSPNATAAGDPRGWVLAGELSSALLLGSAMTAMLMGHSYLIAPAMSLSPLLRLLGVLGVAVALRVILAGVALWWWTSEHPLASLNEVTLLLPVRWALGFAAPAVLTVMAWQTARMRSTQSATGILYVVVIFCFLGELMGLLLQGMTGAVL